MTEEKLVAYDSYETVVAFFPTKKAAVAHAENNPLGMTHGYEVYPITITP